MEVVFVLLPLALVVAGVMLALFIWAVRSGQYDDLETPAVRMLFDDRPARPGAAEGVLIAAPASAAAPEDEDEDEDEDVATRGADERDPAEGS